MSTGPAEIVDNVLADMTEINDWDSVLDAVQANGVSSFHATRADLRIVLSAIMADPRVRLGILEGDELRSIEPHWTAETLAEHIFGQEDPVGAMGQLLIDRS